MFASHAYSQTIQFRCIQVNDSDDVVLFWEVNNIPDTYQVNIYTSLSINGPYALLDSITDIQIDTYTHIGADANTRQNFYYLLAVPKNGDGSLVVYTSDTLENIWFVLDKQGTGIALLEWKFPVKFSINDSFKIERNTDDVWNLLLKSRLNMYNDTITFCGIKTKYRIRYDKGRGCKNTSSALSDFFSDDIAPEIPLLDTVSINPSIGITEIGWKRSISEDTYGYIVYFKDGIWKTLDTLFGANNTFYRDINNSANTQSQEYRIAAIDTCLNASPLGEVHHTLLLSGTTDKCDSIVFLKWNAYENMPGDVDIYRIYISENGGAFHQIAQVAGSILDYKCQHLNTANDFRFYVQAYNKTNTYTSTSSIVEIKFNRIIGTGSVLLRYVTVKDNEYIEIAAHVSDTLLFNNIILYKSIDSGQSFTYLSKQSQINQKETYIFTDKNVKVDQRIYHYRFTLTDECDIEYVSSDTANNILASALDGELYTNKISWTPYYSGFDSCLQGYDVYRKTQTSDDFMLISSETPDTYTFSENVENLVEDGGIFYYKIIATACSQSQFQDESVSNIVAIQKKDTIFIPNSFVPNSLIEKNKTFKPICVFVNTDDYDFRIYSRWGDEIFKTKDINEGWDGTINGNPASKGLYTYFIQYSINERIKVSKRGSVLLIR